MELLEVGQLAVRILPSLPLRVDADGREHAEHDDEVLGREPSGLRPPVPPLWLWTWQIGCLLCLSHVPRYVGKAWSRTTGKRVCTSCSVRNVCVAQTESSQISSRRSSSPARAARIVIRRVDAWGVEGCQRTRNILGADTDHVPE